MFLNFHLLTIILLFSIPELSTSYNYLVFCPLFAHSHHKFLAKIADTLTEAGHNVTFLAPIIVREYEKVKYLEHTKDIIYIQPDEELENIGVSANYSKFWTEDFGIFSMIPAIDRFYKMFEKIVDNFEKDLSVLDKLKDKKFDAMIFESLAFCAHPIHDYLNIKTIFPSFSMTHMTELSKSIGELVSPSFLPITVSPYADKMTFQERLLNTIGDWTFTYVFKPPVLRSYKYPNEVLDIDEIQSKAPFVFFNSNPFLDFPRPMLSKTIGIGGISVNVTQMRQEKLPSKYNSILNERDQTILISFGSMLRSCEIPHEYKITIAKVIESFSNVTFIWKYESESVEFANKLKNVHFAKWVPQTALLADSRLSAFITHAGLGSVNELSYLGKPAILVPIFADQLRNAKMLARHNGSITLNRRDLGDFQKLKEAVNSILNERSYENSANALSHQLQSQPFSPHDLLVKYAEYGAKFGQLPSLDPHYRKMSFFSFFMIDIILFLFGISFVLVVVVEYENVKYLKYTTDIVYIQPVEELRKLGSIMGTVGFSKYWTEVPTVFSMIPTIKLFQKMFFKVYENFRKDLSVLDELKNRKFDAMIYEVIAFNAIAIQQYLGIKTLYPTFSVTHSTTLSNSIGEPAHPTTLSSALSPFGDQMTFQERLMNTVCTFIYRVLVRPPVMTSYSYPYSEIDQEAAESRASFVFLNSNPYLDFPRPTLTKSVLIGGISVNTTQMRLEKLPEEYEEILVKREKIILISFGSIMLSKDMPEKFKKNIVRVIESFPNVTFIWKYESDDLQFARNLKNLHFFRWVPQTALLADSRLSAFITHSGLGSVNELSYMGKPAILVPIFADQLRNAKMLARHNGSICIDKTKLEDFEVLRNSINAILSDESYKRNAEILAKQLDRQPISPQELLLKHALFGAEFGELPSLDPYSRQMSFFTFYMIDIFLFLFSFLFVSVYIIVTFLRFTLRKMFGQKLRKLKSD